MVVFWASESERPARPMKIPAPIGDKMVGRPIEGLNHGTISVNAYRQKIV